jgi:uncharacterized membrane protein YqjE
MADELRRLADGLTRLVRDHVELAKAELRREAGLAAADALLAALALPFLLAALLLFDGALVAAVAGPLGLGWACLLVGLLNLAIGATLGIVGLSRLRRREPLAETSRELDRNRLLLRRLGQEIRGGGGPLASPGIGPHPPEGTFEAR